MWRICFRNRSTLTEISQNIEFPHFQLFQIFAHLCLHTCLSYLCDIQVYSLTHGRLLFSSRTTSPHSSLPLSCDEPPPAPRTTRGTGDILLPSIFCFHISSQKWQVLPSHLQPCTSWAAPDQDEEVDEEVFRDWRRDQGARQDVHLEPLHQQPLLHRAIRWEHSGKLRKMFNVGTCW